MNTFIARHIRQLTAAGAGLVLAAVLGASAQSAHASLGGVCNPTPTPSVTINNDIVYEHEWAKLTVKLSGTSCTSVSMDYKTMDGTAKAGIDYVAKSGTLTFTPGQTAKNLSVQIIDDPAYESRRDPLCPARECEGRHLRRLHGEGADSRTGTGRLIHDALARRTFFRRGPRLRRSRARALRGFAEATEQAGAWRHLD